MNERGSVYAVTNAIAPARAAPRVRIESTGEPSRARVVVDGEPIGPAMTTSAAKAVRRWLLEGALADLEGGGGSKLQQTLTKVDGAFDAVKDLLTNGLR